jgi:hypothetical protein
MPEALKLEPLPAAEIERWRVRRSLAAMGAATEVDLRWYMTYPGTPAAARRAALHELVREGEVVEVAIDGDRGRWYALREDLDALASAGRRRAPSRGATLLSPFDSFLWYRERTQRLFGFDYRIEVYVPAKQRRHGYYTLPLLVDGHLVGRADVKTHRAEGVLELKHVHFERWFVAGATPPAAAWGTVDRAGALQELAVAAHSLATFVGATSVRLGRVTPDALRTPLRRALESAEPASRGAVRPVDRGDEVVDEEQPVESGERL